MGQLASFSALTWLILLLISGAGILMMLHTMAVVARAHMQAHDLRCKVLGLRRKYAAELGGQPASDEILEVDPVEDEPAALAEAA